MANRFLTLDQAKELLAGNDCSILILKYIRMRDNSFRFILVYSHSRAEHKDMVRKEERKDVVSAGMIFLFQNNDKYSYRIGDYGSYSLKVHYDDKDEIFFSQAGLEWED